MLTVGSLFSGIGGFDLGLERAGMRVLWQCEIDPYCQRVLEKHWPDVLRVPDIRELGTGTVPAADIICGGFPCQPVSLAGLGLAQEDDRWLWPEFARLVRELRPRYVIVENVPGLLARGMGDVLGSLAALRYDAEWGCIRAADVGAPHLRERIWIVAYPQAHGRRSRGTRRPDPSGAREPQPKRPLQVPDADVRRRLRVPVRATAGRRNPDDGLRSDVADADELGREGRTRVFRPGWGRELEDGRQWLPEPDVGRVAVGIPRRVDRIASLGNSLVPQVAEWIGWRIIDYEEGRVEDVA